MKINKSHPRVERACKLATSLGCRAETLRGIIDFLKNRKGMIRDATPIFGDCLAPSAVAHWSKEYAAQERARLGAIRHERYKLQEKARTADPEIKRARNDKVFRAKFLRSLTRREKIARTCNVHSMADAIAYFNASPSRVAELLLIRSTRKAISEKLGEYAITPTAIPGMAQLIQITPQACRKACAPINVLGKDATLKPIFERSEFEHAKGVTHWRNGRPQKYERAICTNHVRSFAYIDSERTISYVLHERTMEISLPEGFAWQRDANGLKAVMLATGDDYHVDADDLIKKFAAREIVTTLRANAEKRRISEGKLAEIADDVFVCVADSLEAGNCKAGTLAFAGRLGLNAKLHYPASLLKKLAPHEPRLRIALSIAAKRDAKEREIGYCNLSDHSC